MSPELDALARRLGEASRCLCQGLRLASGVPDYGAYLEHAQKTHPDITPMTLAQFFKDRQDARYGARRFRCC